METGALKMQLIRLSAFWIRMGPKANDWCYYNKKDMETHKEDHVKMEAETGMMQLQAKKHQRWQLSRDASKETWGFSLSASSLQNWQTIHFCCF